MPLQKMKMSKSLKQVASDLKDQLGKNESRIKASRIYTIPSIPENSAWDIR